MPRPRVSPEIKALALDFACVVTTDEGADGSSFVARHGPHSIYAVLKRCCMGAIRDHTPESNRKGISEAEFLRALAERAMPVHNREFLRFRDRKAVKMSVDPMGAGMCMFSNVRWRNPANPTDLKYLREQHKRLSKKYPLFAGTALVSWLETLTAVTSAWPVKSLLPTERLSRRNSDAESIASTACASPPSPPPDSEASWPRCVDVGCLARKRGRDWQEQDGTSASSPIKVVKTLPTHLVSVACTYAACASTSSFAFCGSSHCSGEDVVVPVPSLESLAVRRDLAEPERLKASLETEHPDLLQTWTRSDDGLWALSPLDLVDLEPVSPLACLCNAGFYDDGSHACEACAGGKYKEDAADDEEDTKLCDICPSNSFSLPQSGRLPLRPGLQRVLSGPDGGPCAACAPGKFKAANGSATCVECPQDTYSDAAASTACNSCTQLLDFGGAGARQELL